MIQFVQKIIVLELIVVQLPTYLTEDTLTHESRSEVRSNIGIFLKKHTKSQKLFAREHSIEGEVPKFF